MEDKRHLLSSLIHPKRANIGDYVFVWGAPHSPSIDIVQVVEVTKDGHFRVEGRDQTYRPTDLLPPTEHRKRQYLEALRIAACPVVGAFTATEPLPKFPTDSKSSQHVVGRPELQITEVTVTRTPSNYLDTRFSLLNEGSATISLGNYTWGDKDDRDKDSVPFAYVGDQWYKVFAVEGGGNLYPGRAANYRVVVSNRAGTGTMRLFIPSGILAGAIGTYTLLKFDTPLPGLSSQ